MESPSEYLGDEDRLFSLDTSDAQALVADEIAHDAALHDDIDDIMAALTELRRADDAVAEAAMAFMHLNRTDMRALRFLRTHERRNAIVTPGMLSTHLGISSASTTKLLDRLELGGHVTRSPHPGDRRAMIIGITANASKAIAETVGTYHARRVAVVARLSGAERAAVLRFLRETTDALRLDPEDN